MLSYIINVQAQQVSIDEAKQRASLFFKNNSSTYLGNTTFIHFTKKRQGSLLYL